jgi:hypothetical protein
MCDMEDGSAIGVTPTVRTVPFRIQSDPLGGYILLQVRAAKSKGGVFWNPRLVPSG